MGRWTALIALLLVGCSAEEERLSVESVNCWGHASCAESLGPVRSALGAEIAVASNAEALRVSSCGAIADCSGGVVTGGPTTTPALPREKRQPRTVRADPAPRGLPLAVSTPSQEAVTTPLPEATPAQTDIPTAKTENAGAELVAEASGGCRDVSVAELQRARSLSPADVLCLVDVASGATSAPDPDRQIAAITLYNQKSSGWSGAVEAALKRPALKNAPPLNFAGIKPAYDSGRYSTVVARANRVWRNLDKGYQLSGNDKTFLAEFACRSSGQLVLEGKDPANGLDWCERWLSRASKAGQPTGPIEDLVDQLE